MPIVVQFLGMDIVTQTKSRLEATLLYHVPEIIYG